MIKFSLAFVAATGALVASDSLVNSYHPSVKEGVNVWIDLSLLYWKPWERALVATNKESDVFTTVDFTKASVVHPHFEWDWGYRISSGYLFPSHLWDVEGSWTHFASRVSQHRSSHGSPFIGMFPIWSLADDVIPGDYVFESNLKWKITLNILDLQFGRYLKTREWFDLKPYFGVRSAWIKQHGEITYEGGMFLIGIVEPGVSMNGTDFINMKNNYWGIGPRVGATPRFILGRGFSLRADAAISGLYGYFNIRQKETYLDTTRFSYHKEPSRFRWIADAAAGIEWKKLFDRERYALSLQADWEYHLFFRQFELKKDDFDLVPDGRNLSAQGITFSTRLDF